MQPLGGVLTVERLGQKGSVVGVILRLGEKMLLKSLEISGGRVHFTLPPFEVGSTTYP